MAVSIKYLKNKEIYYSWIINFKQSLRIFLKETGLHGLKFIGDTSFSTWERSFYLCAFMAAVITTSHLISNIYAKWVSTPVIIGISPHATSILNVPFPAITLCNMNQALLSKVANYPEGSFESAVLKSLCNDKSEIGEEVLQSTFFINNNIKIDDFFRNHSQPCSRMLIRCRFNTLIYNCSNLFREIMTDEGLCCVFNMLPSEFLYKTQDTRQERRSDDYVPVDWNPENGYPTILPQMYYPQSAIGTGISMGLSIIVDAQIEEYYCSSANGPGFKIFFHNPIETPNIKEAGLAVPIGYETRFRLEVVKSEAVPNIRAIQKTRRQCIFNNEESLLYYKYYTRRNCENECTAKFLYETCGCIPYNMPLVFFTANRCTVKDSLCISNAQQSKSIFGRTTCHSHCLPSCFDLNYIPDGFSSPLAKKNYAISSGFLRNISKEYIGKNLAVIHFYYRESVYHGDLKNVYVGFTEFLSNIGGVMGLFMGFSFISVAEMIYFLAIKPVCGLFELGSKNKILPKLPQLKNSLEHNNIWHIKELYPKGIHNLKNVFNATDGGNF